jgi:putative transposase
VYHQSVHASLLKPPVAAWEDGLVRRRKALRKPEDPQTFFWDFLPEEWRLIRRDGIQMFNIHYWDNVPSPLAGRSSKPVLIKYDPRNLSRVFYRDKDGQYMAYSLSESRSSARQFVGATRSHEATSH